MSEKKGKELTPEQLEKIAGGVRRDASSSSHGYSTSSSNRSSSGTYRPPTPRAPSTSSNY